MQADGSPLLEQLRDIHGAGPPGWWPPAPGWWVIAGVLFLLLFMLARRLLRWWSVQRRRKAWLLELEALGRDHDPGQDPHAYLAGLNRLFRAVAVRAFPGTGCARLQGESWVAWIRGLLPEQAASPGLDALAKGPYEPVPEFDASVLNDLARTWVKLYG